MKWRVHWSDFNLHEGAQFQPTAVPTLGGFGLWAMPGLMLGTGLVIVGTRKQ